MQQTSVPACLNHRKRTAQLAICEIGADNDQVYHYNCILLILSAPQIKRQLCMADVPRRLAIAVYFAALSVWERVRCYWLAIYVGDEVVYMRRIAFNPGDKDARSKPTPLCSLRV